MEKYTMVFNRNMEEETKGKKISWIPINNTNRMGSYSGLPNQIDRYNKQYINLILDSMRKNLIGWKEKKPIVCWKGHSYQLCSANYT